MSDIPETLWGPLWRHMHNEHGLILLDDECNQIAQACDEARMAAGTPVARILINALRSLSQEELVTLGKAIADRCGHRLELSICHERQKSDTAAEGVANTTDSLRRLSAFFLLAMTITHDTRTGILTVTVSRDEHLAIVDANLPVETETATRGRAILEVIQEEKQIIESVGIKVNETRFWTERRVHPPRIEALRPMPNNQTMKFVEKVTAQHSVAFVDGCPLKINISDLDL